MILAFWVREELPEGDRTPPMADCGCLLDAEPRHDSGRFQARGSVHKLLDSLRIGRPSGRVNPGRRSRGAGCPIMTDELISRLANFRLVFAQQPC